jgi:hypothetical protein
MAADPSHPGDPLLALAPSYAALDPGERVAVRGRAGLETFLARPGRSIGLFLRTAAVVLVPMTAVVLAAEHWLADPWAFGVRLVALAVAILTGTRLHERLVAPILAPAVERLARSRSGGPPEGAGP